MQKLNEDDSIFDGFCHRNFIPGVDGWRNELPDPKMYPSVMMANDIVALFTELAEAKTKIWQLEQELKIWKPKS